MYIFFNSQYSLSKDEQISKIVCVSIWNWDTFGKNELVGEVLFSLSTMNLMDTNHHWYNLDTKVSVCFLFLACNTNEKL